MSDDFLDRLLGDWTYEAHSLPDDGERRTGTETVVRRERWIVIESDDSARFQLAFDPETGRVAGDFINWKWPGLWTYDGATESDRMVLASHGVDPDVPGTTADYQDIWEFVSPDERTLTGRILRDGVWSDFNITRYRRKAVP